MTLRASVTRSDFYAHAFHHPASFLGPKFHVLDIGVFGTLSLKMSEDGIQICLLDILSLCRKPRAKVTILRPDNIVPTWLGLPALIRCLLQILTTTSLRLINSGVLALNSIPIPSSTSQRYLLPNQMFVEASDDGNNSREV